MGLNSFRHIFRTIKKYICSKKFIFANGYLEQARERICLVMTFLSFKILYFISCHSIVSVIIRSLRIIILSNKKWKSVLKTFTKVKTFRA